MGKKAERKRKLGSDMAKVDATTEEDIARHMVEDDAPELTDTQLAAAKIYALRQKAALCRRAAETPTNGGHLEDRVLLLIAEDLERRAAGLEKELLT